MTSSDGLTIGRIVAHKLLERRAVPGPHEVDIHRERWRRRGIRLKYQAEDLAYEAHNERGSIGVCAR